GSDDAVGPSIVVTHSVLGAVVRDIVGDAADVTVLIPNGVDPHDWEPSAQDLELVTGADLVVANGLGFESGLEDALRNAVDSGVTVFEATDYVTIREGAHSDEEAHGEAEKEDHADEDPHFWTDAAAMAEVAEALEVFLFDAGVEVGDRAGMTAERLITLDNELRETAESLAVERRTLVTGHESLGYFADRYGFTLVGAVVPSLTTQAEVSAGEIAELKAQVEAAGVDVVFSELGTPDKTVTAIADEVGARMVEISTHVLPEDGSYETFMRDLMTTIVEALSA
ncbi:MAG: metal ABC transporter substrate-binding protein, partial [Actinomycetota bacterium]